jgi:hypothetical protein
VLNVFCVEQLSEDPVPVAGTIIGEHASYRDAEAGVVSPGHEEEAHGRLVGLIGQDGGVTDPGVVVDGDVDVLPAGAASFPTEVAVDMMTGLDDARHALDIEVDQVARMLVLVISVLSSLWAA